VWAFEFMTIAVILGAEAKSVHIGDQRQGAKLFSHMLGESLLAPLDIAKFKH